LALVEDPRSTQKELAATIGTDPMLAARVLKYANSPLLGQVREVCSIDRAVVLLGRNGIRNITIAARLARFIRGGNEAPTPLANSLWIHSMATGACCKLIARLCPRCQPDDAFLAGLIHDIGIMVELQAMGPKMLRVFAELDISEDGGQESMIDIERRICGADHQIFGRALCEAWKLPAMFAHVTGWHHHPAHSPGSGELCRIVHLAEQMTAEFGFGFSGERADCADIERSAWHLNLNPAMLEAVKAALPKAVHEAQAMI
jgi:HD-like signal output (HDOD) protein